MEWIICPAEGCGKKIKSLKAHYHASHPDLDVPDLRNPGPAPEPEPPQEQATETPSDFLQKLKAFGINPNDIMVALGPLVETSVVQTLEKMQLGEFINKRFGEVEAKLLQEIKTTLEKLQTVTTQPSGDNQPQNTQLQDTILATLAQKFIGGGSSDGGMEQITKVLNLAQAVSDAVNKPRMEERVATRREISETLKMLRDAGASPEDARNTAIRALDQK